HHY
ncbi:binding--dependent transport system inner membrane component family protein, partial [Vibrio parahaemolyticus VP2007-007]